MNHISTVSHESVPLTGHEDDDDDSGPPDARECAWAGGGCGQPGLSTSRCGQVGNLKGTGTRDLIWLKVVSLDRSWLVGLTDDL